MDTLLFVLANPFQWLIDLVNYGEVTATTIIKGMATIMFTSFPVTTFCAKVLQLQWAQRAQMGLMGTLFPIMFALSAGGIIAMLGGVW
jgi:hypothetical protein